MALSTKDPRHRSLLWNLFVSVPSNESAPDRPTGRLVPPVINKQLYTFLSIKSTKNCTKSVLSIKNIFITNSNLFKTTESKLIVCHYKNDL